MEEPKVHFLNQSERNILLARQRLEKATKINDRVRTILHLDQGWTYGEIAEALFLDRSTIRRYYAIYRESGIEMLLQVNYAGKPCALDQEQLEKLDVFVQNQSVLTAGTISRRIATTRKRARRRGSIRTSRYL